VPVDTIWYYDLRADGKCAFRRVELGEQDKPGVLTRAEFEAVEYREDSLNQLRAEMKKSLLKEGLFDDEAEAMLETWRDSYFKSPGTRVFFVVPQAWVDEVLPIKVSVPAKIERAMIGRIDLVTPRHQELAKAYLDAPNKSSPQVQQMYKELGRFAGAIVNDEMLRRQAKPTTPVSMK
jgi:hypothetical protein